MSMLENKIIEYTSNPSKIPRVDPKLQAVLSKIPNKSKDQMRSSPVKKLSPLKKFSPASKPNQKLDRGTHFFKRNLLETTLKNYKISKEVDEAIIEKVLFKSIIYKLINEVKTFGDF